MDDWEREQRELPSWREESSEIRLETRVFQVQERRMQEDTENGRSGRFYVIRPPNWVNVVALTPDRRLVMIEQFRHGIDSVTLEIPGGMVDPGETPLQAARRELAEESGFESQTWVEIGRVHPNPAIQSNETITFMAENAARTRTPSFDSNENCRLVLVPWDQVLEQVDRQNITHSLVICGLHFAERRLARSQAGS